jgi:hypothetical protein
MLSTLCCVQAMFVIPKPLRSARFGSRNLPVCISRFLAPSRRAPGVDWHRRQGRIVIRLYDVRSFNRVLDSISSFPSSRESRYHLCY